MYGSTGTPSFLSSKCSERALDVTLALDVLSNRAVLLACDAVILPLAPDLFSLKGLENVGPTLREWRTEWSRIRGFIVEDSPHSSLPVHDFQPIGYIVQQHLARADRPVRGYREWAGRIPSVYHGHVLGEENPDPHLTVESDHACIASIRHYSSLVPIAQRVRKPLFDLRQADGIGGGQIQSVYRCRKEFETLAADIASRLGA